MSPHGPLVGIDLRACCCHVSARMKARKHGTHPHSDNKFRYAAWLRNERSATIPVLPLRFLTLCPRPPTIGKTSSEVRCRTVCVLWIW